MGMEPVIIRSHGSLRNEITAGNHQIIVDEPVSAGGSDLGPTPYDLLSAALGTCTSMTLHVVAKREGMPLEGVEIQVRNDRMHAADCADCLTRAGYIHRFQVSIRLDGPLSEEQRQRLFSVAKRCPVYKTLTSEIRVDEQLIA